jgi:hypothetical protein
LYNYRDHREKDRKIIWADHISNYDGHFLSKNAKVIDFSINITSPKYRNFEQKLLENSKNYDCISFHNTLFENENKIVNGTFIWNGANQFEKTFGNKILKIVKKEFGKGVTVVDKQYTPHNDYLVKYYWSKDILEYTDRLYMNGGVVQVLPIIVEE